MPTHYQKRLDGLRDRLLAAQFELEEKKPCAIALVVTGVPTAGRSEVVNQFLEWLDAKHIRVHALGAPNREARQRPPLARYWDTLPARGEIAIYFFGWYEDYLSLALHTPKKARKRALRVIERIRQLEEMLTRDRVRLIKLHLEVDSQVQRQRIAKLSADKLTRWRVTEEDRWLVRHHGRFEKVARQYLQATSSKHAPWHVIDGGDAARRAFEAGSVLLKEMQAALKPVRPIVKPTQWPHASAQANAAFVAHQDGADVTDAAYEAQLEQLQGRMALLVRERSFERRAAVLAFEGMDAAGKGGAIRRITMALDARQYTVVPVSAPAPEEFARPYLWRFWRWVPVRGKLTIFDRSWYGRVLVERVRDLTAAADWQRAYDEIREFELQLAEHRIVVHKFWLAVSKDEQLKRLREREADSLKRFKVDPEDRANRRFYDAYQNAAREMIERTHTDYAPWTVVEADDKKYARLKVLRTVCEALEER